MTVADTDEAGAAAGEGECALSEADDNELVARARRGSRDAFGVLVERHQRAVYRVCRRFVGHHDEAADLAQDAFVRAYRALARFKGESSFGTWIYRIAVNVCLNRVTARGVVNEPLDAHVGLRAAGQDPAAALLQAERGARVRAAIARLPPKQRATLVLRVFEELPHQEIARMLGGTVGAAKANLFHALHNLRRILSHDPAWRTPGEGQEP